jgi:hypothetical protein
MRSEKFHDKLYGHSVFLDRFIKNTEIVVTFLAKGDKWDTWATSNYEISHTFVVFF